jgi:hypothetical protein
MIGGANGRGQCKIQLSDLEKGIRMLKDMAPYGMAEGSAVYSTSMQDDALHGNNLDAAEEFDERVACPICHLPAFGAVMTKKCGHHFHPSCLSKALQIKKECPVCRTPMKVNDFTDLKRIKESRFLHQSINDVKVLCTMGCGSMVKFELLKDHVRNSCPSAILLCKHGSCLHHSARSQIRKHESTCGEALVQCACGESIKQKNESEHRRTSCTMKPMECSYCHMQGIPCNAMSAHLENCTGSVPMSVVHKMFERMAAMETRLEELENKNKRRRVC